MIQEAYFKQLVKVSLLTIRISKSEIQSQSKYYMTFVPSYEHIFEL